jgi:2-amino-4-hydroxy-6-hydroxymethyldihydropteridine diphosphokinase
VPIIIFGLGTNLGNREENLQSAEDILSKDFGKVLAKSSIYFSEALVKENCPEYYKTLPFLNSTIAFNSALEPLEVLMKIKEIEKKLGREEAEKWSPRIIDIDILLYEGKSCVLETVNIPHKEITHRDFVLLPLIEVLKKLHLDYEFYQNILSNLSSKTAKIWLAK